MLKRNRRPDFRAVDRWAIELLLAVGAIHKCEHHGWAKDGTDPDARAEALRLADEAPPAGLTRGEATAVICEMLASVGDTCPEC